MELLQVLEKGDDPVETDDREAPLHIDDVEQRSESESEAEDFDQPTQQQNTSLNAKQSSDRSKTADNSNNTSEVPPASEPSFLLIVSIWIPHAIDKKRTLPLTTKSSNIPDENTNQAKRHKSDEHADIYLRGRIQAVQEENKRLRDKIEEMETTWMRKFLPRIDQCLSTVPLSFSNRADRPDWSFSEELNELVRCWFIHGILSEKMAHWDIDRAELRSLLRPFRQRETHRPFVFDSLKFSLDKRW